MRWRMASLPILDSSTWRGTLPFRNPGTLNSWLSLRTVSEVSLSISDGSTSTRRRTLVGLSRSTVVFIEGHRSAEFASLDGGWGAFWRRLRASVVGTRALRRGARAFLCGVRLFRGGAGAFRCCAKALGLRSPEGAVAERGRCG